MMNKRVLILMALLVVAWINPAQAGELEDNLQSVWESFWHQSGHPRPIRKWAGPISVRFTGEAAARHRDFVMKQLHSVTGAAGITLQDAGNGETPNVDVEIYGNNSPLPANEPCVTTVFEHGGVITRARIRANSDSVWRCMLHEGMHLMGLPGHPLRNSVLTYFARSNSLTELDRSLLRYIYSAGVRPNLSPLAALEGFSMHQARLSGGTSPAASTHAFLSTLIRNLEAFAEGSGEPPAVIYRSGKATSSGLQRGQVESQFYLGLAYLNGDIVTPDRARAAYWLGKAAGNGHAIAASMLQRIKSAAQQLPLCRQDNPCRVVNGDLGMSPAFAGTADHNLASPSGNRHLPVAGQPA